MSNVITKPIVHYSGDCVFRPHPSGVEVATIHDVINHPKLGHQRTVYTSEVINKFDDGVFETLNTVYVKVER
jgi:hypothetical protein